MDWDDLKVLLAVARAGTVRAAAAKLKVSHSTVSRRVDQMEADLGVRLFERLPTGYHLTPAGDDLLGPAERAEIEINAAERRLAGQDARLSGDVRVTLPPPAAVDLVIPHLPEFKAKFPGIELELVSSFALLDLSRRDADVAMRFVSQPPEHLVGRRLPDFHYCYYATAEYLARHDLDADPPTARWIGWNEGVPFPPWVQAGPYPKIPAEWGLNDITLQLAAAKAGLGMALLPCISGDASPVLRRVPGSNTVVPREGWILTHPDLRTSARVRTVMTFLIDIINREIDLVTGRQPLAAPGDRTQRRSKPAQREKCEFP